MNMKKVSTTTEKRKSTEVSVTKPPEYHLSEHSDSVNQLVVGDVIILYNNNNKTTNISVNGNGPQDILLLCRSSYFNPNNALLLDELIEISNKVFDTIKHINGILNNKTLAINLTDVYLGLLSNYWDQLISTGRIDEAILYLNSLFIMCIKWEKDNNYILHKGTPLFFLARSYRFKNELDYTFIYTFNAVEEDKRTFGNKYKECPAYMYSSLVDNKNNVMYDYVILLVDWIKTHIDDCCKKHSYSFSYNDFNSKFLESDMEDIKHFFVYNLELLLKYEKVPSLMMENNFIKLKLLDILFNFCLIIDKLLDNKYNKNYFGSNIIELISDQGWGKKPTQNESFSGLLSFDSYNDPPDKIINDILTNKATYNSNIINGFMSYFILLWYLRNFGAHNIESIKNIHLKFNEIIKTIMYSLFYSIKIL